MKRYTHALLIGLALLGGCSAGDPPFSDDFESGDLDLDKWQIDSKPPCEMDVVSGPEGGDNRVLRFIADDGTRCEVVPRMFGGLLGKYRHEPFRRTRWYAFSLFIAEPWAPHEEDEVLAQWHSDPDQVIGDDRFRGPPLALRIVGKRLRLTYGWDANFITRDGWKASYLMWEGPVQTGQWMHWKFEVKWSWESEGMLRVWLGEELLVDYQGPNAYNDIRGVYLKLGLYHPGTERTLYLDDVYIGDSAP